MREEGWKARLDARARLKTQNATPKSCFNERNESSVVRRQDLGRGLSGCRFWRFM